MKELQQAEKRMFRDHPFYTCLYAALKKSRTMPLTQCVLMAVRFDTTQPSF